MNTKQSLKKYITADLKRLQNALHSSLIKIKAGTQRTLDLIYIYLCLVYRLHPQLLCVDRLEECLVEMTNYSGLELWTGSLGRPTSTADNVTPTL